MAPCRSPLILELDLTEPLVQAPPTEPLAALTSRRRTALTDVLDALTEAARDDRVRALVAKVGLSRMGFAQAQELRDAVAGFRAAGKPAIAWAETFGEWGAGGVPYYLATAFEQIWLQPTGEVNLTGVSLGATFLRTALDKLDVRPQFGQRHEYKNAADAYLRSEFSDAHREALQAVADSLFERLAADVAAARALSPERLRTLIDGGPVAATDAVTAGLVDRVGYRDEVYAALRARAGESARLRYAASYLRARTSPPQRACALAGRASRALTAGDRRTADARSNHADHACDAGHSGHPGHSDDAGHSGHASRSRAPRPWRSAPRLALIWGIGSIVQGRSTHWATGGSRMGSDTITAAFRAATRDERVAAIVFRVDSPGGSAVASDAIWREVVLARQAGKPVVVSMGDVAGSGGYWISMAADVIVAEPSTITGSIGVLAGKLVTDGLWNRLGVTHDDVAIGAMARMHSARHPFTDDERTALDAWLDRIYDTFVAKVAEDRSMSWQAVHEVAKGRIWTGVDAQRRGLVDVLGGLDRAAAEARAKAGLGPNARLVSYPALSPLTRLIPPQSSESPGAVTVSSGAMRAFADGWGSFAALAASLGLPAAGPVSMPPIS